MTNFTSKKLELAVAAILAAAAFVVPAWSADMPAEAAMVKMQAGSMGAIKQAAARAGGYEPESVEIKHTAHVLTATIEESKQKSSVSGMREKAAQDVAAAMGREVAGKPEFEGVGSIHVNYVKRGIFGDKKLQTYDFNRNMANVFTLKRS